LWGWNVINTFLDGYCSTVQGLLDWFEVDLGFTELLFIQINLCVMCVVRVECHEHLKVQHADLSLQLDVLEVLSEYSEYCSTPRSAVLKEVLQTSLEHPKVQHAGVFLQSITAVLRGLQCSVCRGLPY